MIYWGSFTLLLAYGLFWLRSPPLLRNKRGFQHFATDMIFARDSSTIFLIAGETRQFIEPLPLDKLGERERDRLHTLLHNLRSSAHRIGQDAGEYEDVIPRILSFYYNWQNVTRPTVRGVIFCLTIVGYSLLLLPAIDLFFRVLSTNLNNWFELFYWRS
jgi:hypothetical protein